MYDIGILFKHFLLSFFSDFPSYGIILPETGWSRSLLTSILSGLITALLTWFFARLYYTGKSVFTTFKSSYYLAERLEDQGISAFNFSRNDYDERLPKYLEKAQNSIEIISISLGLTHEEGDLGDLFRRKLVDNKRFSIKISLLDPGCDAVYLAADSLDTSFESLSSEVTFMINEIVSLKKSLPNGAAQRLNICTHACLPMGSAILLDADEDSGRIQIETKLYKAPRTNSFGFEIEAPSEFFNHRLHSWRRVFHASEEITSQVDTT